MEKDSLNAVLEDFLLDICNLCSWTFTYDFKLVKTNCPSPNLFTRIMLDEIYRNELEKSTPLSAPLIVFFVFLLLFDIEDKMPKVSRELQDRRVAEYAKLGIEYIPADELQRREIEQQEKEAEEIRIKELKEKCEKKGLDFEAENQKVLAKRKKGEKA